MRETEAITELECWKGLQPKTRVRGKEPQKGQQGMVISTAFPLKSSGDTLGPKQIIRTLQKRSMTVVCALRDLLEIMSKTVLKSESLATH